MKKIVFLFLVFLLFFSTACTKQSQNNSLTVNDNGDIPLNKETSKKNIKIEPILEAVSEEKLAESNTNLAQKDLTVYFRVEKVVDGDTIDVNMNGLATRVRFIGINTPESVDPRKTVECFAIKASNRAKELMEGQFVHLEADESQFNRDKYNRLLRYVYLKDGTDVGLELIKEGYAHEYTYNIQYKKQGAYQIAEVSAKAQKFGLWALDACAERETNGKLDSNRGVALLEAPTASTVGSQVFKITNIFYDGVGGQNEPDEYVEVTNQSTRANLKGYTLSDESGKLYYFPDIVLETNQSIKVYTGEGVDTLTDLYWWFTKSGIWNNGGDTATLKNSSGEVVDTYSYK